MRKLFARSVYGLSILSVLMTILIAWKLYPHEQTLQLELPLVSFNSSEGKRLYDTSDANEDFEMFNRTFEPQSLVSYCGVASAVSVLKALGIDVSQSNFFMLDKTDVSEQGNSPSMLKVIFSGVTLREMSSLIKRHEVGATPYYASDSSAEAFRAMVETNLKTTDNYIIVNYQREILGQKKMGHISPLGAYDSKTDSILILDTASHKYPFTWVPLILLFDAMNTIDPSSGKTRGFIEVSGK